MKSEGKNLNGIEGLPIAENKSLAAVYEFVNKENIDPEMSFELLDEKGVTDQNAGSAFWLKMKKGDEVIEGKFFLPKEKSEKLVLFEPGMPGDSNVWMEAKFVPELVKNNYAVFCTRHRGTKLEGEKADNYVNCPERRQKGIEKGQKYLGTEKQYTMEDIANEPKIALEILAEKFKDIRLIGHSGGSAAQLYSLTNLSPEITNKIKNFIGIAGFIGKYDQKKNFFDPVGKFKDKNMIDYLEYGSNFINLIEAKKNTEFQKKVLNKIYTNKIPENIGVILVTHNKDEYIPLETAEQYQDFINRGICIVDVSKNEPEYHSSDNIDSDTLLRLLKIQHPKRKHSVELGDKK